MPAIYAHDSFGLSVISTLPPSFLDLYEKFPEAFRLGFQGPDILFYHKPLKSNPIKKRGMSLHVETNGEAFFLKMGKRLVENTGKPYPTTEEIFTANGAFSAYMAGFLCHFSLDVATHPTIDAHSVNGLSHGKIESEFDKYTRRKDGVKLRGYNVAKDCAKKGNGCENAVAYALDVDEKSVKKSIKTIRFINKMFVCRAELFHKLAHGVLKLVGLNKGKFGDMFMHKKDDPRCEGLLEDLYEKLVQAVPATAKRIENYFNGLGKTVENGVMEEEIFRCNYSGVKYIVTEEKL